MTSRGAGAGYDLPGDVLSDEHFDVLLALAERHRLIGGLAEVVSNGELPVSDRQHARLCDRHLGWMTQSLRVERLLLRIGECLAAHGIHVRVLKGVALARLVAPDPAWRVFGDLDLLVRSEQLESAARVARDELGGEVRVPELRPGFDREFGKEALVRIDGVELDLHRTFVTGPFGLTIDLDQLHASATPFVVGGKTFQALGATELFMHACYNAALGDYPLRLGAVRDLLLVVERFGVDADVVAGTAREWRATAVLQHAAQIAVDLLGLASSHPLAPLAALPVPRRETRLLRSYLTPARSYRRPLASLAVISGVRAKARYARALAAPSHDYLQSRGWTGAGHIRRALRRIRNRHHG